MTNDLLYLLLRASITASLSDREAFIEKVSKIIEQRTTKDPQAARHISDQIASALDGLNGTLLLRQLFTPRSDKKLNQTLEKLTIAVENLNKFTRGIRFACFLSQNRKTMRLTDLYVGYLKVTRTLQIMSILTKHATKEMVNHSFLGRRIRKRRIRHHQPVYTTQERLRLAIEDLGPTYVKSVKYWPTVPTFFLNATAKN